MATAPIALIIATMDTKGQEAMFLANCLSSEGVSVNIMDAGIMGRCSGPVDVTREDVARAGGKSLLDVQNIGHEGEALKVMVDGAIK